MRNFLSPTGALTWSWFQFQYHSPGRHNFHCSFIRRNSLSLPDSGWYVFTLATSLCQSFTEDSLKTIGQYHWVHCLTPKSYQSTASWFTGWISIGGQLVFSASAAFAAGLQFQALVTLNNLDSYTPTRWQGMLFYWLILTYSTSLNIWGSKILPHTNTAAGEYRALPKYEIET